MRVDRPEPDLHGTLRRMQTLLEEAVERNAGAGSSPARPATTGDPVVARRVLLGELARARASVEVILPTEPRPAEVLLEGLDVTFAMPRPQPAGPAVAVRILAPMPAISRDRILTYCRTRPWVDVRRLALVAPSVVVVDRIAAMARVAFPDGTWQACLVRDPAATAALRALFAISWRAGLPLDGPLAEALDCPAVVQVLRHLAEGHTDEVAAREMGVSVRTYRRQVAELMRQLAATSRFQAGVTAAELGIASTRDGAGRTRDRVRT